MSEKDTWCGIYGGLVNPNKEDCLCIKSCSAATARMRHMEAELKLGRALFLDLYGRHWIEGDDCDRQLKDMCDWAGIPPEVQG